MNPGVGGDHPAEIGRRLQRKGQDQPQEAGLHQQHERVVDDAPALPAGHAPGVYEDAQERKSAAERARGAAQVGDREPDDGDSGDGFQVDPEARLGTAAASAQRVAGEYLRQYPALEDEEHDDCVEGGVQRAGCARGVGVGVAGVEGDVGHPKCRENGQQEQVKGVCRAQQLGCKEGDQHRQQQVVDDGRQQRRQVRGEVEGGPAGEPEDDQHDQPVSVNLGRACPARQGGESNADDHRHREAEDHLVAVPQPGRQRGGWPQAVQARQPRGDQQRSVPQGEQEKRAEGAAPEGCGRTSGLRLRHRRSVRSVGAGGVRQPDVRVPHPAGEATV